MRYHSCLTSGSSQRNRYGLKTNSIFHVAILLLPVLMPFHSRSILYIIRKEEIGAGEGDSARTLLNFPPTLFSTTSTVTASSTLSLAIFMADLTD